MTASSSTQCSLREASDIRVAQTSLIARTLGTAGLVVVLLMTATAVVGVGTVPTSPGFGITSSTTADAASKILGKNSNRRARQAEGAGSCSVAGCLLCSDTNGCLRCEPSHYLLLVRDYMQQRGACVLACPGGYYPGERDVPSDVEPPLPTTTFRKCHKCNIRSCASCHSRHYCTHCIPSAINFRGQCYDPCTAAEAAPNASVAECPPNAECSAGPWSPWATSSSSRQPLGGAGARPAAGLSQKLGLVKSRSRDVLVRRRTSGTTDSSGLLLSCIVRAAESRPCGGDSEGESALDECDPPSFQSGKSSAPPPPSAGAQRTTTVSSQVRNEYKPHKRKPRPGAKPLRSCAIEAESGSAATAAQPCHRVRHSGGSGREQAGSTMSAAPTRTAAASARDNGTPPSECGCRSAPLPTQPPPTATGRLISEHPLQLTLSSEVHETSLQRTAASAPETPPATATTLATPFRYAEPPAAGDLLSADYYNYYLRLARQLLRHRQATVSAAALEQPPSVGSQATS